MTFPEKSPSTCSGRYIDEGEISGKVRAHPSASRLRLLPPPLQAGYLYAGCDAPLEQSTYRGDRVR